MKRSVIILTSALLIFIVTLFITNRYMGRVTMHEADDINSMLVHNIKTRMELNLSIRENAVHSLLSGLFYYDINNGDTLISVSDNEINHFRAEVYDVLTDFVKLHPNILSASFLIDPSIYPDKGQKGFAPTITSDGKQTDIANSYDYLHSKNYLGVKQTRKCRWTLPSKTSPLYNNAIIYYTPIFCKSGGFFGTFTITVTLDVLRSQLSTSLPHDTINSSAILIDEHKNIILSTTQFQERFDNMTDFNKSLKSRDQSFRMVSCNSTADEAIFSWKNDNYYVYSDRLSSVPWRIITICPEESIYRKVWHTQNIIVVVSLLGMLLMLVCCGVVFRDIRKHIEQKALAQGELQMAATVQQSLLKPSSYSCPERNWSASFFMRPAREAGGDLYDYVEKDGKLIFCIGDVSGKGMPAALFMTQVMSLFRNAVRNTCEPAEIVTQINDVLAADNPEMTFCTFFIGVLSEDNLTFCNAGHNPPVLITSSSNSTDNDTAITASYLQLHSNLALGLMEGYPYQSESATFKHGDRLVAYTDGVTEAKNRTKQLYGENRLLSVLTELADNKNAQTNTNDINALIIDSIDQFVQHAEQSDDITIASIAI